MKSRVPVVPNGGEPCISVVLAAVGAGACDALLDGLAPQLRAGDEVILVGGAEPDPAVGGRLPSLRWLPASEARTVPARWAHGLDAARCELVATSTLEHEPLAGWLDAFRRAHAERQLAGVGGAIGPPSAGSAALAVWALRYSDTWSSTVSPTESGGVLELRRVPDLAADNACYRRCWLERYRDRWSTGFWEPEVHRPMVGDGGVLVFDPFARLVLRRVESPGWFARQRFVHGRRYGGWRARSWTRAGRLARLFGAGLVPAVLVRRSLVRSRRAGIGALRLAGALPWLVCFTVAWALGEARGVADAMLDCRSDRAG